MSQEGRIHLSKNQFAKLISEVDNLCPLCQENLIVMRNGQTTNLSQAAISIPTALLTQKKNFSKMFRGFLIIRRASKI